MADVKTEDNAYARCGMSSIAEMVAALQCDYDRLEELRDERDGFTFDEDANAAPDGPGYANDLEAWAAENPEDAEELKQLEAAAGECTDRDDAAQRIFEDPLSLEVRSGWVTFGDWNSTIEPEEFCILLTTGGPALRIRGELSDGEPSQAWLEYQDWGTPWTEYHGENADQATLLAYCRAFCWEVG